jgi:hypothetical protein
MKISRLARNVFQRSRISERQDSSVGTAGDWKSTIVFSRFVLGIFTVFPREFNGLRRASSPRILWKHDC